MVSPSLLLIAAVAAYPIAYAVWLSLHEYSVRVAGLSRWAGLTNYSNILQDAEFWDAVRNTFIFTAASVTLEVAIGMAMAADAMPLSRPPASMPYRPRRTVVSVILYWVIRPSLRSAMCSPQPKA